MTRTPRPAKRSFSMKLDPVECKVHSQPVPTGAESLRKIHFSSESSGQQLLCCCPPPPKRPEDARLCSCSSGGSCRTTSASTSRSTTRWTARRGGPRRPSRSTPRTRARCALLREASGAQTRLQKWPWLFLGILLGSGKGSNGNHAPRNVIPVEPCSQNAKRIPPYASLNQRLTKGSNQEPR